MSDVSNLRDTILAKSDQLNSDDILGGGITITVTLLSAATAPSSRSSFTTKATTDAPTSPDDATRPDCRMGREWRGVGRPQHVAVQQRAVCQVWRSRSWRNPA